MGKESREKPLAMSLLLLVLSLQNPLIYSFLFFFKSIPQNPFPNPREDAKVENFFSKKKQKIKENK
jgi:hypothetical protein